MKNDPTEMFAESIKQELMKEICSKLEMNDVNLLANFEEAYKEITMMTKEIQNTFRSFEKKMNKIVSSPSLYEDVYKMRDELIEIKKLLQKNSD